jgi:TusA-related sulfurtransferase
MAARAQQVMPFDLSRTHHTFSKMPTGGVETVIVTDPSDAKDIALIRAHLRMEAQRFRQGDYADPARIHGMDMAGVHQLAASAAEVSVDYADLPNGGHISYSASDPALISALHAWFDRQTSDHAMPGMGG